MEQESTTLREAIRDREEELRELRRLREQGQKGNQRSANTHRHIFNRKYPYTRYKSVLKLIHLSCAITVCVDFFFFFRTEQLEKEVAILKEKIHHLDDMLKSQQRKVRHMIEQVRGTFVRLCKANTLSPCSYLCRIYSLFDSVFACL